MSKSLADQLLSKGLVDSKKAKAISKTKASGNQATTEKEI